jgi:metal-responsive CopG/Arc/MetJ family transcriptional regulator
MPGMARTQTLVQLNDDLLARLDARAGREGRSRSDLIREAIKAFLHDEVEAEIDRQIVEGYRRIPVTDEEMRWAEANARELIAEEPWDYDGPLERA